jgi:hypothetical protein
MLSSTHNTRIELALADLASQSKPNYKATAKKYEIQRTTLARRYKGQTHSREAANSEYRQRLNHVQEETLIRHINKLTDRGIPPTSQMVKNIAEEIAGLSVGKNWTSDFVRRHKERLKSLYLRNIDNLRTKAEYAPLFKQFYDLVEYTYSS